MTDVFIVNVAAPRLRTELHASFAQIQLVLAGYVLAYAVGLITGGRLGDRHGRKRMLLVGVGVFTAASAGCALAPSPVMLILARLVQGLAAAMMLPQVLALIHTSFSPHERGRALSGYGATLGLSTIGGQLIGGLLLAADPAALGWRVVFWVNVPLGLLVLATAGPTIVDSRSTGRARIDIPGAGVLAGALVALLYPLVQGPPAGWPSWTIPSLATGLTLSGAFLGWERHLERHHGQPLVPIRLFAQPGFRRGLATALAFYSGNAGLFLTTAFFVQDGLRRSPLVSGLVFLPLGAGFLAASITSGPLTNRYRDRGLPAGPVIMLAGLLAMIIALRLHGAADTPTLSLLPGLLLCGIGQGVVVAPLVGHVLATIPPTDAGAASGALLTTTQTAMALGVAVIGTVYVTHLTAPGADRDAFTWALAICALATATSLVSLVALTRAARAPR